MSGESNSSKSLSDSSLVGCKSVSNGVLILLFNMSVTANCMGCENKNA